MPTIHLTTFIAAPVEIVFNLSRSVDLHKKSMRKHQEEAVAGTRYGLMEREDTVTWKAKHFFKTRILRVKISDMKKNELFTDEQVDGDFKKMKHEHYFKPCDNGTIMIDLFHFESPYGTFGKWFNGLYFTRYMRNLLEQRNTFIKEFAENGKWKQLLAG
jgi:ligand-binding SRPBCC domain-containing protein